MFKSKFLFILIFFISIASYSSEAFDVSISGVFPGAEGKIVRLVKYDDFITYRQSVIEECEINDKEEFEFHFTIYEPQYLMFRIDHAKLGMFVEPGKNYHLTFEPVNFNELDDKRNPYLEPYYFPFEINNADNNSLDALIDSLDNLFDSFVAENFSSNQRIRLGHKVIDYHEKTDSLFSNVDNDYFNNYYKYKFAKYYRVTNAFNDHELALRYFYNQEILYNNLEYMSFFNNYFDNYIFSTTGNVRIEDVEYTVNELSSYTALMDSLGRDSILRNEVLREMVLLKSLSNIYYDEDFVQANVEDVINQVAKDSKFAEHRKIAENILWAQKHLRQGSPAPDFTLKDESGIEYTLEDFEGKFLYLSFFTSWCVPCMAEFPVKEDLYQEYGDIIEFVSISVDRHKFDYERFLRENDFSWRFFHFDDNYALLDDYDVTSFPVFVLIGPDGNIISYPSLYPSIAIRGYLDKLRQIYQMEKNKKPQLYYDLE